MQNPDFFEYTMTSQKYFSLLCEMRRLYRIEIVAEDIHLNPVIQYEVPTREDSISFLEFLRDELAIYSTKLIDKLHLDRIILGTNLVKLDDPISGCASMSLFADNLPFRLLFRKNTIYLAVDYCNTLEGRIIIHHELFHAIEAHEKRWPKYLDTLWPNLNPPAFRYRQGISTQLDEHHNVDCSGFLSSYSMETVREDKAELFAHMIVNFAYVNELASKDKFLRAKMHRLKQLLKEFSAEFDDSFWKERGKIH